ncbi:GDP-mannose 4,6-dehydratase [Ignisphaera sp. 4213-co]|uniref:GDP-mannose 4,6-dehydratase n=1 Tax=Ignisphaera cupida TaxID=3050454 RepID=A0ABD4Z3J7_9CREN|nr:GDP-mannose 4,6-dehydratase [Ignisphaera sp. 4213-co]MDK6027886.1 GDP-mannose 4,6-dehydratase [Ignisphaera sp. 4213-co]
MTRFSVDDVVNAIMLAIRNENAKGVYNIGSGTATTINNLAKLVLKLMGKENLKPVYTSPRPGDIKHSVADITKAMKELGYRPNTKLENGLKQLITQMNF